jgi:hypothetical protein
MQEKTNVQISDIVHLNSGSPDLRIIEIKGENVDVEWQSDKNMERATFPVVCVR